MVQTLTSQGAAHWAGLAQPGKHRHYFPEICCPSCSDDHLVRLTDPLTQPHCVIVGGWAAARPSLTTTLSHTSFYSKPSPRLPRLCEP